MSSVKWHECALLSTQKVPGHELDFTCHHWKCCSTSKKCQGETIFQVEINTIEYTRHITDKGFRNMSKTISMTALCPTMTRCLRTAPALRQTQTSRFISTSTQCIARMSAAPLKPISSCMNKSTRMISQRRMFSQSSPMSRRTVEEMKSRAKSGVCYSYSLRN